MKTPTVVLVIILLLGFMLRIAGINFGLPDIYHADEPIIVNHAMAYGSGDFNPHFFNIPPFISYLLFFCYGLFYVIGHLSGVFHSPEDFALSFIRDPSYFYIIGRVVCGVFFGTASIFILYKLAKKMFSEQVALLSALFFSVCFLHVQQSHYIYVDVSMVFLVLSATLFSISIIGDPSPKNYFTAACLIGLVAATKYNAILAFATIPAALLAAKDERVIPKTLVSLVIFLFSFVIFNPFSLFDFGTFYKDVSAQGSFVNVSDKSGVLASYLVNLYHHLLKYSLREGAGISTVVFGIVGVAYFLYKNWKLHLVYLLFPILFYLSLAKFSQSFERYALPLVPFLIIYASAFIFEKLKKKFIFFLAVLTILIPNLEKSLYSDLLFMRKDTRTLGREWVEKNIPAGSRIAIEHSFLCPHLRQSTEQIKEKLSLLDRDGDTARRKRILLELKARSEAVVTFNLYYLKEASSVDTKFLFEKPQLSYSIPELKKNGIQYVILHVDSQNNFKKEFYQDLTKNGILLQEFSPYIDKQRRFAREEVGHGMSVVQTGAPFVTAELLGRARNGYIIKIYRLN